MTARGRVVDFGYNVRHVPHQAQPRSFPLGRAAVAGGLSDKAQTSRTFAMSGNRPQKRIDALAQLKVAQGMIQEGRDELKAANKKIQRAQKLIDESAKLLRDSRLPSE